MWSLTSPHTKRVLVPVLQRRGLHLKIPPIKKGAVVVSLPAGAAILPASRRPDCARRKQPFRTLGLGRDRPNANRPRAPLRLIDLRTDLSRLGQRTALHCRRDPLPGKSTAAKHPNPFMPGWLDAEPVPRRPSAGSVGVTPNDDAHPERPSAVVCEPVSAAIPHWKQRQSGVTRISLGMI